MIRSLPAYLWVALTQPPATSLYLLPLLTLPVLGPCGVLQGLRKTFLTPGVEERPGPGAAWLPLRAQVCLSFSPACVVFSAEISFFQPGSLYLSLGALQSCLSGSKQTWLQSHPICPMVLLPSPTDLVSAAVSLGF